MKISVALAMAYVVASPCTTAFVVPSSSSSPSSSVLSISRKSPTTTALFVERLAEEGDWAAYLDEEKTGLVYYYNPSTGESLWEPPTSTFPNIRLTGEQLQIAQEKRREYRESLNPTGSSSSSSSSTAVEEKVEESSGSPGFFASFMEDTSTSSTETAVVEQKEVTAEPEQVEEEETSKSSGGGWFGGLFDSSKDDGSDDTTIIAEQDTEELVVDEEEKTPIDAKPVFSFGNFFSSGDDANADDDDEGTNGFAAVEEEVVVKEKKSTEPKPVFSVFGGGKKSVETVVDEVEEVEQVQEEKKGGLFGMFGGGKAAVKEEEEIIEEIPEEVETKPFFGNVFGGIKGSYLVEPRVDDPAIEEEEVIVVSRPTFSLLPQKKLVEEFVEEDEGVFVVEEEEPLKLDISSTVIPHPQKMSWGGEDAAFVNGRTFGVFDGVSGATKAMGVPLYSKVMSGEMKKRVGKEGLYAKDIENIMTEVAKLADAKATGATTAVVASITEDGYLRAVNLGDSGCIVIRNNAIVSRTKECVHYFDCPYQLSVDSPDRPRNGRKLNVEVQSGDIILMASDGVFDNLSDQVIIEEVTKKPKDSASSIASRVAKLSRKISLDKYAVTPYATAARRNGNPNYKNGVGGKIDDTSCIVVRCQ
mmetsp:Transcript_27358/g.38482  ORF Transcript_27358/g.38482 Transcript_27358/m.38482 type:complete len:642 (-) Transcript_27358:63-1988(-)